MRRGGFISAIARAAKSVLTGWLALEVLTVSLLAANPDLHRHLHEHGTQEEPSCPVCLFATGHVDTAVVAVAPALPASLISWTQPAAPAAPRASFDYRFSLTRAPPGPVSYTLSRFPARYSRRDQRAFQT